MTKGYSFLFCNLCASMTSLSLLQPRVGQAHCPAERKISVCGQCYGKPVGHGSSWGWGPSVLGAAQPEQRYPLGLTRPSV